MGEAGRESPFEEAWEFEVLEDHLLWSEYGCPIDLRTLPQPVRQAHVALILGQQEKRREEREEQEREAKKAKRKANRAG